MGECPECAAYSPPCRETGYDADDFCSGECEEKYMDREEQNELWKRMDMHKLRKRQERKAEIITVLVAIVIICLVAFWAGGGFAHLMEVLR